MFSFFRERVRRVAGMARRSVRPMLECLEDRNLLSADATFNFAIPAGVGNTGQTINFYMYATLESNYTPSSGPDQGTPISAGTVVYLEDTNGVYDWATPTASANVPAFQTVTAGAADNFSVSLPNTYVISGDIVMGVGSTTQPFNLVANSGTPATIPTPTPAAYPNNIYDFAEFTYNAGGLDTDLTEVDQVGLPYTVTTSNSTVTDTRGITQNLTTLQNLFTQYMANTSGATDFENLYQPGDLRILSPKDYLETAPSTDPLNNYFNSQLTTFFNTSRDGLYANSNSFNLEYPIGFNGSTATDFVGNTTTLALPSAITGASESGGTVTITAANNFSVGDEVVVTGVGVSGYDGAYTITGATSTSFNYTDGATGLAASSGGLAEDMNYHPTTGSAYTVLQLEGYGVNAAGNVSGGAYTNTNGTTMYFNVYEPFFSTNSSVANAPPAPSWLTNSAESPGEMVFSQDGVFNSGSLDPTVPAGTAGLVSDLENAISSAFNRGIATNLQPNDWANAPLNLTASSGNSGSPTNDNLVGGTTYYYVITATNSAGETTVSNEVTATPTGADPSVTLNWTAANGPVQGDNGPLGVLSYNIYRGTGSGQEVLIASGQTNNGGSNNPLVTFTDTGLATLTATPPVYYATGSTSNYYAAFLHQNSTLNPTSGVTVDGLAYGFPYDDQGGNSTNVQLSTPASATITLVPWSASTPPAPPSSTPTPSNNSLPLSVNFLFLTEDQFAWTVDSMMSQFSSNPSLTQVADQMMMLLNSQFGLDNPALGTGLAGLQSAINANPLYGTLWGYVAQAEGLEWAANL